MAMAAEPGLAGAGRYQAYDRQREMAAWPQSDCDAALKEKSRQSQGQIHRRAKSCGRALGILRVQIAIPRGRNGPESTMTQIQAIGQHAASPVSRFIALLYGVAAYVAFFVTILYAIGFVSGLAVQKATIDTGTVVPIAEALIVNLLLMSVFAVQHSVMARKQFKQWWTQFVPKSVERSTYVLFSSLALMLLFWQWRPMPAVVWHVDNSQVALAVTGLSLVGWLTVFTSTFLINHFELFGVHQVANNLTGRQMPAPRFRTPLYYKFVRHPIYLGFIIAFWAAPTMTVGHLLFAAVTTAYIFVGILLEERDLIELFGDDYRRYKERVSMLLPWRKSA
jgi:protein-S-isoprenylcysteine O-methyltransferase Ste14